MLRLGLAHWASPRSTAACCRATSVASAASRADSMRCWASASAACCSAISLTGNHPRPAACRPAGRDEGTHPSDPNHWTSQRSGMPKWEPQVCLQLRWPVRGPRRCNSGARTCLWSLVTSDHSPRHPCPKTGVSRTVSTGAQENLGAAGKLRGSPYQGPWVSHGRGPRSVRGVPSRTSSQRNVGAASFFCVGQFCSSHPSPQAMCPCGSPEWPRATRKRITLTDGSPLTSGRCHHGRCSGGGSRCGVLK